MSKANRLLDATARKSEGVYRQRCRKPPPCRPRTMRHSRPPVREAAGHNETRRGDMRRGSVAAAPTESSGRVVEQGVDSAARSAVRARRFRAAVASSMLSKVGSVAYQVVAVPVL